MVTKEQVLTVYEDSVPLSLSQCHEKVFTPSTFCFDGGLETK
jgi:hypothetical protein